MPLSWGVFAPLCPYWEGLSAIQEIPPICLLATSVNKERVSSFCRKDNESDIGHTPISTLTTSPSPTGAATGGRGGAGAQPEAAAA